MENQIESYIQSKGWDSKFKNGEYCLSACPLKGCGPGHFYINREREIFYCQKCGDKGTFLNLKYRLGDIPKITGPGEYPLSKKKTVKKIDRKVVEKYHQELLGNVAALSYLQDQRGFTLETIKKFKLGFDDGNITIPYFRDGECLNVKFRPIRPKPNTDKYFREEGCQSILFNLDNALQCRDKIIITEGEFDTISYDQMRFPNVVSIPTGAKTFDGEWIDDLEKFSEVYLSYDMDEDGRNGIEKAVEKIGRYRCFNVLLPLKDANDCLKAGMPNQEMLKYISEAKPFDMSNVKAVENYHDQLVDLHSGKFDPSILTGWIELDNLLGGGLRPGELTIVTGETSSGKTTWTANLNYNLSKRGYPVLSASFEMKPVTVIKKMVQMETGIPFKQILKNELENALNEIESRSIRFIDHYGEMDIGRLKDAIYYSRRRYGVEVVVIDHLHFFLKYSPDQERQAIDAAVRDMKAWAMELGIHIVLIVHPTKLSDDNKVVRLNDLKGSSGLKQIPDSVISIWRDMKKQDQDSIENEVLVYVLKCRDDSGNTGEVILNFNKRSQSYKTRIGAIN